MIPTETTGAPMEKKTILFICRSELTDLYI